MKKEYKNAWTIKRIHEVFENANYHYGGWLDDQLEQIIEEERQAMLDLYKEVNEKTVKSI